MGPPSHTHTRESSKERLRTAALQEHNPVLAAGGTLFKVVPGRGTRDGTRDGTRTSGHEDAHYSHRHNVPCRATILLVVKIARKEVGRGRRKRKREATPTRPPAKITRTRHLALPPSSVFFSVPSAYAQDATASVATTATRKRDMVEAGQGGDHVNRTAPHNHQSGMTRVCKIDDQMKIRTR